MGNRITLRKLEKKFLTVYIYTHIMNCVACFEPVICRRNTYMYKRVKCYLLLRLLIIIEKEFLSIKIL